MHLLHCYYSAGVHGGEQHGVHHYITDRCCAYILVLNLCLLICCNCRGPRPGEQHGVHYYFTDTEAMSAQVAAGMFLEHAQVHGNMYGTSLVAVARVSSDGKHCVLDIDVQGAQQVRRTSGCCVGMQTVVLACSASRDSQWMC
jgi:guanylate kinase